jgi:hypothetical protein
MKRAWLILMMVCGVNAAHAETSQSGHKAELQVGAPLRMALSGSDEFAEGSLHDHRYSGIEPAVGAFSSLSQSLNTDDQPIVVAVPDDEEDQGMAYSVTKSLSLGIRYNFVEAEDMVGDLAVAGLMDTEHQSHHVVFRAKWQFQ